MTTVSGAEKSAVNGIRTALGVGGVLALIVGLLITFWPGKSAVAFGTVVAIIIAIYLVIAGLVYAGLGIFSKEKGGWSRVGHIALGVVFVIAGVLALLSPVAFAGWLALFFAILIGITWIIEGVVALTTLSDSSSKGWSIFFAIVSIIAGIVVLFSPLWGIVVLWWLLGISLIVLGVINVVRAFTFGK